MVRQAPHKPSIRFVLLVAFLTTLLASCTTGGGRLESRSVAYANEPYPIRIVDRSKFAARFRPAMVAAPAGYAAGTIVIDTKAKLLFLINADGKARRYGIAVGASGHAWSGAATIGRKAEWPAWYPTDDMHAQTPDLPRRIEPGFQNPLGARALYLYQDGKDTLYRVHGTSEPWTIGTEASSGCIRMINEDIIDIYGRVAIGTSVVVL
ncbi:L,D-transpeptidase [Candidatus Phyllobacterium onerii]|uniref:L,D-transpeptidase n=1 Tax=Candidatus Phyllobacterium onerii TaxID=3020828 RepID=UPI002330C5B8|nr:L,D-transpeptidase [Phyllobacterium sp. IY22]